MLRREVLVCGCIAVSSVLPGCATGSDSSNDGPETSSGTRATGGGTPDGTDSPNASPSSGTGDTDGFDAVEDVAVVLGNHTGTAVTVRLAVSTAERALLDADYEVGLDGRRAVDPGITATGEYGVSIAVRDGPETTATFDVEDYDLRAGSNLVAEIEADRIQVLVQE